MDLKRNLKRILADRDLTVAKLSRATGVPKSTLAEWLNGGNPRDLRKVKLVAEYLGESLDSLCFGEDRAATKKSIIETHADEINAGVFEVILRKPKR